MKAVYFVQADRLDYLRLERDLKPVLKKQSRRKSSHPQKPPLQLFFTETANTFNLQSEKRTNHWRLKLWSYSPSSQILQTRKSHPWALKYDGQWSVGIKFLLNCQKQVMHQKSNLEMQKAVTLVTVVNQFKPFLPLAVPKRRFYADFRRFAFLC